MKQKSIQINGLQIACYDNEANKRPLVFIHGNSLSSETFSHQFSDDFLSENFRIIAPDIPGHGNSDWAKEPGKVYTHDGLYDFIVNFIKALDLNEAVFVGHSMGGHMLMDPWEEISYHAAGLVIFGAPPFTKPLQMEHSHYQHPGLALAFKEGLTDAEMHELAKAFVLKDTPVPDVVMESIKKTDPSMRPTLGASSTPDNIKDEATIIKNIKVPVAVLHGEGDQLIRHTYFDRLEIPALWKNKAQLILNAGHCPQVENPNEFNRLLIEFLQEKIL